MDGYQVRRGKVEGFFTENFGDSGGNLVRFFGGIFVVIPLGFRFVVTVEQFLDFVNGDVAFDVPAGGIEQIFGQGQSVDFKLFLPIANSPLPADFCLW